MWPSIKQTILTEDSGGQTAIEAEHFWKTACKMSLMIPVSSQSQTCVVPSHIPWVDLCDQINRAVWWHITAEIRLPSWALSIGLLALGEVVLWAALSRGYMARNWSFRPAICEQPRKQIFQHRQAFRGLQPR